MCGIAGYISTRNLDDILSSAIKHRGPDDYGTYRDNHVLFAHRRLSIQDLSERGHQPMISSDGNYVIIFNGEIYNHLDIRKKLIQKGYRFQSTSDTETLLYGYIEHGPALLDQVNGIFAFAIYDKTKKEVFLCRDQFGVKPLYLYQKGDVFLFSSELKSFLGYKHFDRTLNYGALFNYLQYLYCPGNITPFKFVTRMDAGHYMKLKLHENYYTADQPVQYYRIPFSGEYEPLPEKEWVKRVEDALLKSVERQLLSDAPLGFFLSGGLDSSLIVAMASKLSNKPDLNCFTISTGKEMVAEGMSDDLFFARKVAESVGCNLNIIDAAPDILKDFDKTIWHLDEPQADPAAIHVYNISKGAQKMGIKVLLGGAGGDDVFSGYRRHFAVRHDWIFDTVPGNIRRLAAKAISSIKSESPLMRRAKRLSSAAKLGGNERLVEHFSWHETNKILRIFNPEIISSTDFSNISNNYYLNALKEIPNEGDKLNQMLFLELKTFLINHNLNYTDKMSMAAGVEARVPYLDLDLVNLSTRIPPGIKMKGNVAKYILKKVAENYLPKDVIYRSKAGFAAPIRSWVKRDLKPLFDEKLSESSISKRNIFNPMEVQNLIRENTKLKADNAYLLFALLAIDSWMEQFLKP